MDNETDELILEQFWVCVKPYIKRKNPKISEIALNNYKQMVLRYARQRNALLIDYTLAKGYHACSIIDLRVCESLFKERELSTAVYHLQQAAEKAVKSISILIGYTNKEKLASTPRSPQPILEIMKTQLATETLNIFSRIVEKDYKKDLKTVNRIVNSEPSNQRILRELSYKSTSRNLGVEVFIKIFDVLGLGNPSLELKVSQIKQDLIEILPEYRKEIEDDHSLEYGQVAGEAYILGALTFVHENTTRYPALAEGLLEPKDYTEDLGIVIGLPELIARCGILLNSFSDLPSLS
jgi:hypothetical protein